MKKTAKLVSINLALTAGILLLIEVIAFLALHLESKLRMKNEFQKDPVIGTTISRSEFSSNPNSKYWSYQDDGRYLSRPCNINKRDKQTNLIISGGSTSFPLGTVHSGKHGTWIDHLINELNSTGVCVNIFSISMPGFSASDEVKSLTSFLDQKALDLRSKTFLISLSGINEIKSNTNQLTANRLDSVFMPQSQLLIKKAIKILSYSNVKKSIRVDSNIDKLTSYDESFLTKEQIHENAKEWLSSISKMHALANSHNIKLIQILQPTLGVDNNPVELADFILAQKDFQQSILNANVFDTGYFYGINLLYDHLSENCNAISACIDGSNTHELQELNVNPELYQDYRHPNSKGNEKIATFIFTKLDLRLANP